MKYLYATIAILIVLAAGLYMTNSQTNITQRTETGSPVRITPIEHASFVLTWGDTVIYNDPVGGAAAFAGRQKPDVVLVSHIHGDHMDPDTLEAVLGDLPAQAGAVLIAPQSVKDALPPDLASRVQVLKTGETTTVAGITISAIPAYNMSEAQQAFHPKSRGDNGYVLEKDGFRVYIAGDTSGTPEMRALKDIDIAFVPMNLPYTMDVDEAASAVLDFKPRQVYPYHYRGQGGLSDVARFKTLVNEKDPAIEVILGDWYK